MSSIKVRNESRPTRCEICHQVDQFDADRNFCARCNVLPVGEAFKLQDTEELRAELAQLSASVNEVAADLGRSDPPVPIIASRVMLAIIPEPESAPEEPQEDEQFKVFAEYTTGKYRSLGDTEMAIQLIIGIIVGLFLFLMLMFLLDTFVKP
jgi:hypothetical protein